MRVDKIIPELNRTITLLDKQYQSNKERFGTGCGHLRRKIKAIRAAIKILKEKSGEQ
jgi:uncharacterized protein YaaN involved in tellurite resistance